MGGTRLPSAGSWKPAPIPTPAALNLGGLSVLRARVYILTGKTREGIAMANLATTRLSSKGQVVIPEDIRRALGLEAGDRFVVVAGGDVVLLKRIDVPARSEVRALAARARSQARRAGVKPADVRRTIREVRRGG